MINLKKPFENLWSKNNLTYKLAVASTPSNKEKNWQENTLITLSNVKDSTEAGIVSSGPGVCYPKPLQNIQLKKTDNHLQNWH